MQSRLLTIIATISVILGGAIAFGFGNGEAVADTISDKYCGIWENEYSINPSDPSAPLTKRYFKVTKLNPNKYKFTQGYQYKEQIIWINHAVENSDGIYLAPSNGKLVGHFISPNFWATHSRDSSIEITLEAKPNGKVRYSEKGIIGRTTYFKGIEPGEVFVASKTRGSEEHAPPRESSTGCQALEPNKHMGARVIGGKAQIRPKTAKLYQRIAICEIRRGNEVFPTGYPVGNVISNLKEGEIVELISAIPNDTESMYTLKVKTRAGEQGYITRNDLKLIQPYAKKTQKIFQQPYENH